MMDIEKFRATSYERRTKRVPVPALSYLFPEGAAAELVVQSLSGPEVFKAEERKDVNANVGELVQKLLDQKGGERVSAALEALGISGDEVPARLVKAIAFVEFGVQSVQLTQADAVRLAEYHIDTFLALFKAIDNLTALGYVSAGELNASGQTDGSATPSSSAPEASTVGDSDSSMK